MEVLQERTDARCRFGLRPGEVLVYRSTYGLNERIVGTHTHCGIFWFSFGAFGVFSISFRPFIFWFSFGAFFGAHNNT